MSNRVDIAVEEMDEEWIKLIQTAREIGLTIEEIRHFLGSEQNCVNK